MSRTEVDSSYEMEWQKQSMGRRMHTDQDVVGASLLRNFLNRHLFVCEIE
jgi:hypothetical protein